jgi:hypothetical protein
MTYLILAISWAITNLKVPWVIMPVMSLFSTLAYYAYISPMWTHGKHPTDSFLPPYSLRYIMSSDSIASLFAPSQVITPADGDRYEAAIRRWSESAEKCAKYVVFPKNAQEVSHIVSGSMVAYRGVVSFFFIDSTCYRQQS